MENTELHSEYKGNVIERYKQKKNDTVQMAQDIEEKQKRSAGSRGKMD